ncbi:unnamed protein product, partial [Nesidiocoris tenuis]
MHVLRLLLPVSFSENILFPFRRRSTEPEAPANGDLLPACVDRRICQAARPLNQRQTSKLSKTILRLSFSTFELSTHSTTCPFPRQHFSFRAWNKCKSACTDYHAFRHGGAQSAGYNNSCPT